MFGITKGILRWGLIGTVAVGGLALVSPTVRGVVANGAAQVKQQGQKLADLCVDDTVALRRQLEQLTEEYPDRIAEVRGELAQVDSQIAQFERDLEVADRVVAMTTRDLGELKALVQRAEDTDNQRSVLIRFEGQRFDLNQAYGEATRINNVRQNYKDRAATNEVQLAMLAEQRTRLTDILGQLEAEYSDFQTKLWQLDRQIDSIERNERLIDMTEELQATLASYDKWGSVGNLNQLESKLAEMRTIQEAQLDALRNNNVHIDYEDRAKFEIDQREDAVDPFADIEADQHEGEPKVDGTVAWMGGPIVIE